MSPVSGQVHLQTLLTAADEHFDPYAERILEAAREQLLDHGLRRTSLEDIAQAADVSRATLFRRFPNRDALIFALAAREAQASIARVDSRVAGIEDAEEFLVTGALALIREITGNGLLQRLLVTDPEQVLPLLTSGGGPILAMGRLYIVGHLQRLRESGTPIEGDLDVLGEMLGRLTLSLAVNPDGVLPLGDEAKLAAIIGSTVAPLVLGR